MDKQTHNTAASLKAGTLLQDGQTDTQHCSFTAHNGAVSWCSSISQKVILHSLKSNVTGTVPQNILPPFNNIITQQNIGPIIFKVLPTRCNLPRSIYFYKLLCMFQAVPPPNIRSTKLYIASGIVKPILLLSWMRWN